MSQRPNTDTLELLGTPTAQASHEDVDFGPEPTADLEFSFLRSTSEQAIRWRHRPPASELSNVVRDEPGHGSMCYSAGDNNDLKRP